MTVPWTYLSVTLRVLSLWAAQVSIRNPGQEDQIRVLKRVPSSEAVEVKNAMVQTGAKMQMMVRRPSSNSSPNCVAVKELKLSYHNGYI